MKKTVGIAGAAFNSKSVVNVSYKGDSAGGHKMGPGGSAARAAGLEAYTTNVLCAPVISEEGRAIGVIQATNKASDKAFSAVDEEAIQVRWIR